MNSILVSGAGGFIGRAIAGEAAARGWEVRGALRTPTTLQVPSWTVSLVGDLLDGGGWERALDGVGVVVHCAALAHAHRGQRYAASCFRRTNVEGTVRLASLATKVGVKRLVYISSIGVHGATSNGQPLKPEDEFRPHSDYAKSKCEAELALAAECGSSLEMVVIRPPLVYGRDAPGSFSMLLSALRKRVPLPLGLVNNARSFIGIDNLVDLVLRAAVHPRAPGNAFLASDGEDLSTPNFIRQVASAVRVLPRLLPVPVPALKMIAIATGQYGIYQQLCESLIVDISKTTRLLDWTPRKSVAEGLSRLEG